MDATLVDWVIDELVGGLGSIIACVLIGSVESAPGHTVGRAFVGPTVSVFRSGPCDRRSCRWKLR